MEHTRTPEERLQRAQETINKGTKRNLETMTSDELAKLVETRLKRVAKAERQREKRSVIEAAERDRANTRDSIYRLVNVEPTGNPFNAGWGEQQLSPQERAEALTQAIEHFHQLEPEETARLITRELSSKRWQLESAKNDLPAAELQWELWDQYAKLNPGRRPLRAVYIANALRERLNEEMITSSQFEEYSQKISGDKDTAYLSPPRYYRHKIEHSLAVLEALTKLQERLVPITNQEQPEQIVKADTSPNVEPQLAQLREQALASAEVPSSLQEPLVKAEEPTPPVRPGLFSRMIDWLSK